MTFSLLRERAEDARAIEFLLDRTFGPDRAGRTVYRLREGIKPLARLSWIAADAEGQLLASIRYWSVLVSGKPAILLGPIAVEPSLQGRGIGKALIHHSLYEARRARDRAAILVGDPLYYRSFGFTSAPAAGLVLPGPVDPARFQVLELRPGGLDGLSGVLAPDLRYALSSKTLSREGSAEAPPCQGEKTHDPEL